MKSGLERCNNINQVQKEKNKPVNKEKLNEQGKVGLSRWRLILGQKAENHGISFGGGMGAPTSHGSQSSGKKSNGAGKAQTASGNKKGTKKAQSKKASIKKAPATKKLTEKKGTSRAGEGTMDAGGKSANTMKKMDDTLTFVYNTSQKQRSAGLGPSNLTIPRWIENVNEFFPNKVKEILENDLVKKSNIADLINHPELFEKVEPSIEMVKTIIALKHMLPEKVKEVARKIVKKVVDRLKNQLKSEVEKHIVGAIKRDIHSPIKIFRNIDWKQSIQRNLKHYDPNLKKLIMAEPRFFSNEKKRKAWQIIVLIDESGSMTDSVIYSVVMGSIFSSIPALNTNLIIFDTQVVDLSSKVDDPVDILMSVQLGGGTDITKAVRYGRELIKKPKKTIMVIISDFYEGRPESDLIRELRNVLEGGTKILGIAALCSNAQPFYNKHFAKQLSHIGIDVIASTPESLPEIIAKLMNK